MLDIPDIAGKAENIRFFQIDIIQDFRGPVIDGVLRQFHRAAGHPAFGTGFQALNGQVGMNVFGINRDEKAFHSHTSFCSFLPSL